MDRVKTKTLKKKKKNFAALPLLKIFIIMLLQAQL
jgi:hypothetical protein